ncbi:MAG TPA: trigger factor [Acidobacteriota bacterium]|nr:trigger factor [Acidobacteriota bacterium]
MTEPVRQETKPNLEMVDVSSCLKNLVVEVPADEVQREVEKLAKEYAKSAKVPGFRPGKVPLSIIKQRYSAELRNEATHEIIQRCWKDAVRTRDLHPLSEPTVKDVRDEAGLPLKFTVSFEILPKIEVTDYKGVAVTLPSASVGEEDVDKALEALREQNAQFVPYESGEIKDGHYAMLTIDGEFEGGGKPLHEDDVTCVVGDPQTNETFSENLRGAKLGDSRSFDVTYPADYHRKRFAGKTVHYHVIIKDIKEKHLADLNEEFAKDLGAESLDALRTKVRDDLITNARRSAEKKAREAVLDTIVQRHSFEVPESLVQEQLEEHARRIAANLARQGVDVNKTSIDWKKVFEEERPHAEQAVRRSLVLEAIARQESLDVTEAELEAEFQKLAETTNKSAPAIRAQFEKDKRIQSFTEHLLRNKALDFIHRNANISGG